MRVRIPLRVTRFQAYLLVSAALIGIVSFVSGLTAGHFFEAHVLSQEEQHTAEIVQAQARQHLSPADFQFPHSEATAERLGTFLEGLPGIFRLKVFDPGGRIVWSNEPRLIGRVFADNRYLARALEGRVITVLEAPKRSEHLYEQTKRFIAEAYVPVRLTGEPRIEGVLETYKDATTVVAGIERAQHVLWALIGGLGALLYVTLAAVVWNASVSERRAIGRLEAQNRELTLIQQFSSALRAPLDVQGLAASMVASAAVGLDLAQAQLYRVAPDATPTLLARLPDGGPEPPDGCLVEAVRRREPVVAGTAIALPLSTPERAAYCFVVDFGHLVSAADRPAIRTLGIMLDEAAIALANVHLFTEIREAHERLAAILAGIADRMVIVDREMRVVWMNEAALRTAPEGMARGQLCYEAFGTTAEDACHGCPAVRTLQSGTVERGMRVQRLPGGGARYLDLVTAPLRDETGRVRQVLEVARDITELVEMEERVKQSAARLEESHAELLTKAAELERANSALRETQAQLVAKERLGAVGDVVVGLHHAVLNPLTGIMGALQVLKQDSTVPERTARALVEAEGEIHKIEQIIRRLPSLTRAAGSPYVGSTTMLDLEQLCDDDPASGQAP